MQTKYSELNIRSYHNFSDIFMSKLPDKGTLKTRDNEKICGEICENGY